MAKSGKKPQGKAAGRKPVSKAKAVTKPSPRGSKAKAAKAKPAASASSPFASDPSVWGGQLEALLDSLTDHVYYKDRDSRFTWVNRNMLKVRGLSHPSQLIGKTDFDIHPPDRARGSFEDERRILATGMPMLNKLETDVDEKGDTLWMLTTKIPVRDGEGRVIGTCGLSKDVTAQVLGEQAAAKEKFLREEVLENVPDNVYFKDRDSRFTWVNGSLVASFGFRAKEEVLGKSDADFFTPEHAREAREDELRIMETGRPQINKLELDNYPDGSPRWVYSTKMALRDAEGNVIGTCGLTKDVTPLKMAEEALARDSALRNDLLESVPDIVYFKDRDSRFTWVNRAMVGLLGQRTKEEVLGKSDADFFTPEHAREARADEERIMATGEPVINKLERDNYADGSPRWVYSTKMPLRDREGNVIGTCGMGRDVTSLKKIEEALAQESSLLSSLLEYIPDAVYFKDRESRFIRVGRGVHLEGAERPEDVIGKTDFDYFTQEHAQQAFDDEQAIMRTGIPITDKIEKETYPNKPDTWVSTTKVPVYDSEGKVTGIVGISRDVTERFKAEEAVRKAKDELEIRVQERTAALVQEIKEHLRTEKALRDGERKLQEINQRLATRVEQLNFLNASAHRLAHFTRLRDLEPAIVEAFARCREGLEVALLENDQDRFRLRASTPGLRSQGMTPLCEPLAEAAGFDSAAGSTLIPDLRRDARTASLAPGDAERAFLQIPLRVKGRISALVQIFGDLSFAMWYSQEEVVINTLAAQAAVSLSNANNFESLEARARVEGELAVAQDIQRRFTPEDSPDIPRVSLKGVYYPAFEVGGDYLDYFRTEKGNWVIVVADVSGKGIPAALVMTMLRSTVRAEARYESSAKRLLCSVNDLMKRDLDEKSFITAACLVINPEGTSMTYARAGHPPLMVQRGSNGGLPKPLSSRGLALGLADGEVFAKVLEEIEVPLDPGDSFLMYTDGLIEAMDPERRVYGTSRLQALLTREKGKKPEVLVRHILDDVRDFTQDQPYHDDLTMLVLGVNT